MAKLRPVAKESTNEPLGDRACFAFAEALDRVDVIVQPQRGKSAQQSCGVQTGKNDQVGLLKRRACVIHVRCYFRRLVRSFRVELASQPQNDGIKFHRIYGLRPRAQRSRNIVARACARDQNIPRMWNQPVGKVVIRRQEPVWFSVRILLEKCRGEIGEPLIPHMIGDEGVGSDLI